MPFFSNYLRLHLVHYVLADLARTTANCGPSSFRGPDGLDRHLLPYNLLHRDHNETVRIESDVHLRRFQPIRHDNRSDFTYNEPTVIQN